MPRVVILLFLCGLAGFAETVKLYLKDGTFQLVREYQVQTDRVRYYSTERSDWEEIPKELVDLDRTKKESAEREVVVREEAKAQEEEDKAERTMKKEIAAIPQDSRSVLHSRRQPRSVEASGSESGQRQKAQCTEGALADSDCVGQSYCRGGWRSRGVPRGGGSPRVLLPLGREERFGIVKLTSKKGARVVEKLNIVPVSNEVVEEQIEVETFKKQVGELVYKIWPTKPLEPGEYALIEFTPTDFTNKSISLQAWDFTVGGVKSTRK
jgi:hypothetical protein